MAYMSRMNKTYLSELRKFINILDRVVDVMTAVAKVNYCLHFLMYSSTTFFCISGAVWTHSCKFLFANLPDGLWNDLDE